MPSTTYTLNDYQAIKTVFTLQAETLAIINELANRFGASLSPVTETIREHNNNRHKSRNKGGYRNGGSDDAQWQTIRDFKPTVVLDKQNKTNDIRVALNKLSAKNYDGTSEFIIEKIKEIVEEGCQEDIQKITATIFDTISTNKIFAQIYAQFYKTLVSKFPDLFTTTDIPKNFLTSIDNLRYADPNTNYDEFCVYNKENDKRKATALFITHLVAIDAMPIAELFFMINRLLVLVNGFIREEGKTNEVEEITENVFLLVTNIPSIMNHLPDDIRDIISVISNIKLKEFPSITSRAIFKYVDIVEKMGDD